MSEAYIINSMGQFPDLTIEQAQIIKKLRGHWSQIEVKENIMGTYILRWLVHENNHIIIGGMQSDNQTITIESDSLKIIAEFALWYRKLVPKEYTLFLYKGSTFDNPIELTVFTSEEEITQLLAYL